MDKNYYVYILSNEYGGLYVGVTNNLTRRIWEHKEEIADGYTKRFHIHRLVYFEETNDVLIAIEREKQIKGWRREKKLALIIKHNLKYEDLSKDWFE